MSIKLFNKKTGGTAICERLDWIACRDHNPSKGWSLYTPDMENSPERKSYLALLDEVLDNNNGVVSLEDYDMMENQTKIVNEIYDEDIEKVSRIVTAANADPYSEEYAERAAALREKNVNDIRIQGIGSNFMVFNPKDGNLGDDSIWFGECNKCGQTVSNDKRLGLWEHRIEDTANNKVKYITNCPTVGTSQERKTGSIVKTDELKAGDRLANIAGTVIEVVKHKGSHKRTLIVEWQGKQKNVECSKSRSWVLFNR